MKKVEPVHSLESIKLLADARRRDILRLLMASPATLTQLARTLRQSPAWIRHHMLVLESAGLVEVSEIRKTKRVTEKFYRARADALLLQEIILPRAKKPMVIFSGSHDLALEGIAEHLQDHVLLLGLPVGSLDGLVTCARDYARSPVRISWTKAASFSIEASAGFVAGCGCDRALQKEPHLPGERVRLGRYTTACRHCRVRRSCLPALPDKELLLAALCRLRHYCLPALRITACMTLSRLKVPGFWRGGNRGSSAAIRSRFPPQERP